MALKRKDDYQILTRIEAKQDDMSVTLELLKKDVANIDKSINTDNGVKCIQTRLKGCEDKIVQFNSDYRYADGWTGRYLRRIFKQNGFKEVHVTNWTHSDTESESFLHLMARRIANAAAAQDHISKEECQKWIEDLDKQALEGNFFSSIGYFCCQGVVSS